MIVIKANPAMPINIGHQGENDARCIQFDLSEFQTEFPSGIPLLIVQRPSDTTIYPIALDVDGTTAIWTVTGTETEYTGLGKCVLQWSVDDVVVKSCMYITMVAPSLILGAGTVPDEPGKSWYEHILSEIGNLENLTTKSKDNLVNAINEAAKTGSGTSGGTVEMRVSDGYIQYGDGATWTNLIALSELKGKDGTTPKITASKTDKTTTISVDGKAVAEIKDGENGTNGDDGFSPTAYVSKTGTVTTVKIIDKTGTTTAEINDGTDGKDGENGTSVTVSSISESTADGGSNVVTFSDGKTLTVKNGSKGSDGPQGEQGIQGPKGDTGATGAQGPQGETGATGAQGEKGADGVTPSFSIGTVETLAAGSDATASITGTDEKPVLNLGIPKGADGSGGGSSGVTSFNGRTGAVTPKSGDYTADMVGADSSGSAAAVQKNLDDHEGDTTAHITAAERTKWNGKQDKLTFDETPTSGSTNPVTSGGVKSELDKKADSSSLNAHTGDTGNPHKVTAAQAGADPSGTAASAVSAHNSDASAHSDIRTALNGKETAGAAEAVQTNLDSHTGNTTVHVTANERSTWNAKSGKAVAFTVTLTASGWSSNAQTVSDSRFLASGYAYTVRPAGDSFTDYVEASIYADNIDTAGKMTFHCSETPTASLVVNILRTEVTA